DEFGAVGAEFDVAGAPEGGEFGTAGGEFVDEGDGGRIVRVAAGDAAQLGDGGRGDGVPVEVEVVGGRVEEQCAGHVLVGHRTEDVVREGVCGQHVEKVGDDDGRGFVDEVEHAQQFRTRCGSGGFDRAGRMGERVQVLGFDVVEPQGRCQRIEDLGRGVGG